MQLIHRPVIRLVVEVQLNITFSETLISTVVMLQIVITNQSGSVIENISYSPFGEVLSGGNVSRFDYDHGLTAGLSGYC